MGPLIWILYNREYELQEAWMFNLKEYQKLFQDKTRLSPEDMRKGSRLR